MPPSITVSATQLSAREFAAIHQEQQRQRYPPDTRHRQIAPLPTPHGWHSGWWDATWLLLLAAGSAWGPPGVRGYIRLLLIGSLFTAAGLWYRGREYRRAFRQSPTAGLNTRFEIIESGVVVEHQGRFTTFLWPELYRVRHLRPWLLLYPNPEYCYYLDLRNVNPPASAADVLQLLEQQQLLTR
ncbi:hypothetical protein [Hymenobacter sp. APR13]|uniref:hypothetical protein n=1 Tax=Hymenobacter sp. APR13 TaxID=1356852 RepID=UPI0004E05352|nr:hypothetical protein [Hymenobacter sp. APR13]AII50985.1 hypothetical protein N008_03180 [Hymenobacter sp. APR13]